jgi:hypothetical protein
MVITDYNLVIIKWLIEDYQINWISSFLELFANLASVLMVFVVASWLLQILIFTVHIVLKIVNSSKA